MAKGKTTTKRGRLDHILPQRYLEGFTDPLHPGQVSVYDVQRRRWFESGTPRVGAVRRFYDYSPGSAPDQTADDAFKPFEDAFPNVRRELVKFSFSNWTEHLPFLLSYAQMLRARSELFREHALVNARAGLLVRVEHVTQGEFGTRVRLRPLSENIAERDTLFQNMTITRMRTEISNGPGLFSQLQWCLRFTTDPDNPVVTGEVAVVVEGKVPSLEQALQDAGSLFFFPVCWQACLIGSRKKFEVETEAFNPTDLRMVQQHYLRGGCRFAYSPKRLGS